MSGIREFTDHQWRVVNWSSKRNPADLPWGDLDVDLICECTGVFTTREKAGLHIEAGAKKVIISAPGKEVGATVVYGVNDDVLDGSQEIISNASHHKLPAPMVAPLRRAGYDGYMTTIRLHNDQQLSDVCTRTSTARSATMSMIRPRLVPPQLSVW